MMHAKDYGVQGLRRFSRTVIVGALALMTLSGALVAGCTEANDSSSRAVASPSTAANSTTLVTDAPVVAPTLIPARQTQTTGTADFRSAISGVAQEVRPAVVQITNEQEQPELFSKPLMVPAGVGSGVIYDGDGHILTNNHVISGAQGLLVSLPDGRTFPGTLIGADPETDLAVVQISGSNLPVAQLGDSNALQIGDWVVAIGNALALEGGPTVSKGVVSALQRTVQEPGEDGRSQGPSLFGVIQTDAPINPGNSGGPLVDLDGRVVGINTLVATQAEPGVAAQGIGFAISMATARPIADQLVAHGKVIHPYSGIGHAPLSASTAAKLGVDAKSGAVVTSIDRGSPAERAGLRRNDVIVTVDGQQVQGDSGFAQTLSMHKPDDTITLGVLRGKSSVKVQVTLTQAPAR
jgi:serine protease Do